MREYPRFKREARLRRAARVRRKLSGTAGQPRLSVFRSNKHIFAQLIDDEAGRTIAAASDLKLAAPKGEEGSRKVALAKAVGLSLAEMAKAKGVEAVVFDRAGYKYHGRVAALAEGARKGGLKF